MSRTEAHILGTTLIVLGVALDGAFVHATETRPLPLKVICGAMICFGSAVIGARHSQ